MTPAAKPHHDQNSGLFTPQGPRVYTFFMYLSTPAQGGGTKFNNLGLVVPAIQGNAVLWPSVANLDPERDEPKTNHEALPVEEGIKFVSNVWIHNYDYRTPSSANWCALAVAHRTLRAELTPRSPRLCSPVSLLTHKNTH